jgi:putative modified peptide
MSQRGVERALGRLVTDEGFRDAFFADPEAACLQIGVDLTFAERQALRGIPRKALADLCGRLDDRICRLHIPSHPAPEERA